MFPCRILLPTPETLKCRNWTRPRRGQTCGQLALEIKAALEKDYYYHATVILAVDAMAKSHGRVDLVGAVRLPGPVELPGDEVVTLSKAILRAGDSPITPTSAM